MHRDFYAVLGISPSATPEQIRAAYYRLARRYHPDVDKTDKTGTRFRAIHEAYHKLSNAGRRQKYDRQRIRFAQPVRAVRATVVRPGPQSRTLTDIGVEAVVKGFEHKSGRLVVAGSLSILLDAWLKSRRKENRKAVFRHRGPPLRARSQ